MNKSLSGEEALEKKSRWRLAAWYKRRIPHPFWRYLVLFALLYVVIFGGTFGFVKLRTHLIAGFLSHYSPPPAHVDAVYAGVASWHQRLHSVGTLEASTGVEVSSETSGKVVRLLFNSGDFVKAGQPLVLLDTTVDKANLKGALASLTLAKLEFQRGSRLLKTHNISRTSFDKLSATLNGSQARVDGLRAALSKKTIRAPFSGRTGLRHVNVGQFLTPGVPLVSLQDLSQMHVRFSLPEQEIPLVTPKARVSVRVGAYKVPFLGTITAFDSKVDPITRNFSMEATINNPDGKLLPGMFSKIEITLPHTKKYVVLPATAVTYSLHGDTVYIAEDTSKNNKKITTVRAHVVTVGPRQGDQVAILKGVKLGDRVVIDGQLKLHSGAPTVLSYPAVGSRHGL